MTQPTHPQNKLAMSKNEPFYGCRRSTEKLLRSISVFICVLLAVALRVGDVSAAQLIWDPANTNNGPVIDPGSGTWDIDTTTNINWNNGTTNVSWAQTSTTAGINGAIFNGPDAADGTYQVTIDGGQIAYTNLQINANGYVFLGDTGNANNGNALFQQNSGYSQIADGKSVIFSNNIVGPGNQQLLWILGTGPTPATMTLLGRPGGPAGLTLSSTNGSTVYLGGTGPYTMTAGLNVNANVWVTNGTYTFTVAGLNVGRNVGPFAGKTVATAGTMYVDGPNTIMNWGTAGSGAGVNIGQGTGQGRLVIQNGATFNAGVNSANGVSGGFGTLAATYRGELDIYGGTFNIGNEATPSANNTLGIMGGGCVPGCTFILYQTNGTFTSYGGIKMGGASGSFSGGYVAITNAGGVFNIGPGGISLGTLAPATNYITFSGGTVTTYGGSWTTALPITLATDGGNITFQCADTASGIPYNITLNGALSGSGGFNKTGSGILTLGGSNQYTGSTVVSNGTLVIKTATGSTNGAVFLDGSGGSPVLSTIVGASGQSWTIGDLNLTGGFSTLDFNFGAVPPSATVAPVQSSGNVAFTAMPNVTIEGSSIAAGVYPLIHYAGAFSGTVPGSVSFSNGSASSGYLTNIVASKTLALVVTGSSYTPAISWGVGNGVWDIATSANWISNSVASTYADGDAVLFDDTASGTSPVLVTLNTSVHPGVISAANVSKSYVISGTGSIDGSSTVTVAGAGSLTLSNANTYTGGTTVTAPGQLNINYDGDNTGANSAIGTGPLTLNTGAKLDNTSGHPVTLTPAIQQLWNDDWTYLGSANLSTGPGSVTMGNNLLNLTVVSNVLEIPGFISDNGQNFKLLKLGNGQLTLRSDNFFSGGFELVGGTVNIGSSSSLGSGNIVIDGGAIDNVSGSDLVLNTGSTTAITWANSFAFLGTTNLDLGFGTITPGTSIALNVVSNTLTTEGSIIGGNSVVTKTGAGTWVVTGSVAGNALSAVVNQGELDLARAANPGVIGTGGTGANGASAGLTVQSNALAKITGITGNQITDGKYVPVVLNSGGIFDMNGQNETVDLVTMNNGVLRNSLATSVSTLTILQTPPVGATPHATNALTLATGDNSLDVPSADASLNLAAIVNGSGNLVKTGLGTVSLLNSNNYTGNITINDGVLSLSFPDMTNTATVTIATNSVLGTNAVLNLNFANGETNTVSALVVGGVSKAPGLYSATTDPLYITGTGSLLVVPVAPSINPFPGVVQINNAGGSNFQLSWPTNAGWILQSNSVGLTATSSWFSIPNSTTLTNLSITVDPGAANVFFRLLHP